MKLNIEDSFSSINENYAPKILMNFNASQLMAVKLEGDLVPWHSHEADELFIVIKGSIEIFIENKSFILSENDVFKVPKGALHKVVALEKSNVLLIESSDFRHTGDINSLITKNTFEYV